MACGLWTSVGLMSPIIVISAYIVNLFATNNKLVDFICGHCLLHLVVLCPNSA
jgi:hypothetical protein